jgi:beta-glucosidase
VNDKEGVFLGYRGYDRKSVKPLFPFGYGLSYTKFDYSNLKVKDAADKIVVEFDVKNSGKCDAAEVAQVYIGYKDTTIPHPVKELKGYDKVVIKSGATHHFVVEIPYSQLECYDILTRKMVRAAKSLDDVKIFVGASAEDIRLSRN